MKTSWSQVKFMLERVAEDDPLYPRSKDNQIAEREKVFCNYTLLRSQGVSQLPEQAWKDFFDRRWRQFALSGYLVLSEDPKWAAYWKHQTVKATLDFHVKLPLFCTLVVSATKQKLRDLAERSLAQDKVCRSVPCGSVNWLFFSVRFFDRCSVLALITHGCTHAS